MFLVWLKWNDKLIESESDVDLRVSIAAMIRRGRELKTERKIEGEAVTE